MIRLGNAVRALCKSGPEARREYLHKCMADVARLIRRERPAAADLSDVYRARVARANAFAYLRYQPRHYSGEVALFIGSGQGAPSSGPDPRLSWVSLADRTRSVHTLSGVTSGELLRGEIVRELAAQLKVLLSATVSARASG
jgi:hypothetical protein